jgi:hypothetical protein
MSRSYIREDQMDPVVVSKVDVSLRLALSLSQVVASLLEEIGNSRLVETMPSGSTGMSLDENHDLQRNARDGKELLDKLMKQTRVLPDPLRVVECEKCQCLWLGSDVMRWRDLETMADLVTADGYKVAACPACDLGLSIRDDGLEYITLRFTNEGGDENDE